MSEPETDFIAARTYKAIAKPACPGVGILLLTWLHAGGDRSIRPSGGSKESFLLFASLAAACLTLFLAAACGPAAEEGEGPHREGEESPQAERSEAKPSAPAEEPSPLEAVNVAYKTTAEAQSARMAMNVTTTMPAGARERPPVTFVLAYESRVDYASGDGVMTMSFPGRRT